MNKLLMTLILAIPVCAHAGGQNHPKLGEEVRAWTDLQRNGIASVREARPMPGEVADKVYERYLQSFATPIPKSFERENFVGGSSGGK